MVKKKNTTGKPENGRHVSRFTFHILLSLFLAAGLISAISSSFADLTSAQSENAIDSVVAVVNNQAITMSALENELIIREIKNPSVKVKQGVLRDLIEQKLLLQEAERVGILLVIWQEKVDAEIEAIKSKYPSEELFFKELKVSGLAYKDLEEWIKSHLILDELIVRRFRSQIDEETIEQQAVQYFQQNRFVQFQFIKVLLKPADSLHQKVEAQQLSEEIYSRLQAGAKFGDIQQSYKDAPNLQVEYHPQIIAVDTKLGQTIAELENGKLSKPLLTPEGYLIARLLDDKSPYRRADTEVMKEIKSTLIQREEGERIEAWLKEQWEMGDIRIMDAKLAQIQIADSILISRIEPTIFSFHRREFTQQ